MKPGLTNSSARVPLQRMWPSEKSLNVSGLPGMPTGSKSPSLARVKMLMAPRRLVAAPLGVFRSSSRTILGCCVSRSPQAVAPAKIRVSAMAELGLGRFMECICRNLRSEAKVHPRHPVADLGLREEVGSGEVASPFTSLPEAVHLGVDPAVIVDGPEVPPAQGQAGAAGTEQSR